MAKSKKTITLEIEAIGPSESGYAGYGPQGANPSNPSDEIFAGRALPTTPAQDVTQRRSFNEATRSPLHYLDGPGTDENVTSRSPRAIPILGNAHSDFDHQEVLPITGTDKNRYSAGPDESKTLNGVEIYGT